MHAVVAVAFSLLLAGCVRVPADDSAVERGSTTLPASASAGGSWSLTPIASAAAPGGYALRVWEDRAYVATFTTAEGVSVFDVSDPAAPVHLGGIVGTLARSVDVLDYGARIAVAISTGTELEVWGVTDPASPVRLASFAFGSHNVQVHPTAKVVYNARNVWDGVGGAMEIVDARDPDDVKLDRVWTFPPFARDGTVVRNQGCHDLTVFPEVARAYCAAYEQTLVLDVTDPFHPEILTAISNPLVTSHHTAFPILNYTVLVVGDEFADNFVWGCLSHPVAGAPQPPGGGLWFYDLTTPTPQVLGHVEGPHVVPQDPAILVPLQGAMCTSHNGSESPDVPGLIAYGWFHAGIVLVDARNPVSPVLLDIVDVGGAVGDARWFGGRVFAADDAVGLTVLELDATASSPSGT